MTAALLEGFDAQTALRQYAPQIDRVATAFCQRADWLSAAATHCSGLPALATIIGNDGTLTGFLALEVGRGGGITRISGLGGDLNDYPPCSAPTPAIADELTGALTTWLADQRRWVFEIEQMDAMDLLTGTLLRQLPGSVADAGDVMPQMVGLTPDVVISRARRKAIAQACNRLSIDGCAWSLDCATGPTGLDGLLSAMVALRRERDHALSRRSHLDSCSNRAFYRQVVTDMVSDFRADIRTLTVEGELAGYAVCVRDGSVHRLWDGRVAVGWERYSGGRLCAHAAFVQAVEDPTVDTFDWLRGESAEKIHNQVLRRIRVSASCSPRVGRLDCRLRRAIAAAKERAPAAVRRAVVARS